MSHHIMKNSRLLMNFILTTISAVMLSACSSNSPTHDIPPLPFSIKLVEPTAGRTYKPKEEVKCVMELASPPGEQTGAMVSVGIWKGENDSRTKFGQVVNGASPDGVHELKATLIAPEEPGKYTVKATAQGRDKNKQIKIVESEDVEITVQ